MLMLLFNLGSSQYAIPARDVAEVVPLVRLEPIAMAPEYVAGLFNYRGDQVPVIDLCQLVVSRASEISITTRLILVQHLGISGDQNLLGLLAERVTETADLDPDAFSGTGITIADAPFLGDVSHTDSGLIRKVHVNDLLPDFVQALLFSVEAG
ncbi:MAG: chemotaxis protein CheW [Thiogranum sp.]|nr:chemotaxis protein CheW [Thiogranum sp.]